MESSHILDSDNSEARDAIQKMLIALKEAPAEGAVDFELIPKIDSIWAA